MRVLISPDNSAKFGCFISINEKIINNLPRWGRLQSNFRRLQAEKLRIWDPKKVFFCGNDGTDHLYHHAKFGDRNRATHVGVRERNVMFITFFIFYYLQDLPKWQLCRYCFTHEPILGVFAPQERHVAPIN